MLSSLKSKMACRMALNESEKAEWFAQDIHVPIKSREGVLLYVRMAELHWHNIFCSTKQPYTEIWTHGHTQNNNNNNNFCGAWWFCLSEACKQFEFSVLAVIDGSLLRSEERQRQARERREEREKQHGTTTFSAVNGILMLWHETMPEPVSV